MANSIRKLEAKDLFRLLTGSNFDDQKDLYYKRIRGASMAVVRPVGNPRVVEMPGVDEIILMIEDPGRFSVELREIETRDVLRFQGSFLVESDTQGLRIQPEPGTLSSIDTVNLVTRGVDKRIAEFRVVRRIADVLC